MNHTTDNISQLSNGAMQEREEAGLLEYWDIVRRRKYLLIALCAVSVTAAMAISLMQPKYYRSEAVILAIAPEPGGLVSALSSSPLAGALGASVGGLSSPADRILVFLKSRTVAEMVIRRFGLLRVFNERKWDAEKGAWKDPAKPPLMEEAVTTLGKKITSFKKSKEGTITIAVEWKDPKLAAEMANYYVAALTELMKNKSVNTTVQVVDPAVPAEKKSSPRTLLHTALAGIASLLAGLLAAVVLEYRSRHRKE